MRSERREDMSAGRVIISDCRIIQNVLATYTNGGWLLGYGSDGIVGMGSSIEER
jgi:hypothetical protein